MRKGFKAVDPAVYGVAFEYKKKAGPVETRGTISS